MFGDTGFQMRHRPITSGPMAERHASRPPKRSSQSSDLVVISALREWTCSQCGSDAGRLLMMDDAGPVCMTCADLDHLVFLPSGDAALTRRAKAASGLSAVVVRFSRARKRYERQGVLVEDAALQQAEAACLADEEVRARRRQRDAGRRAKADVELQARLASEITDLFPGCPLERAEAIARHAAERGSGRVGRSAAGRALDAGALELAVAASVRHEDTSYDELLMSGLDRVAAPELVRRDVQAILALWRGGADISCDAVGGN